MKPTVISESLKIKAPFFANLVDIIRAGEFIPPELAPIVGEGIEILGEMNNLEKALSTAINHRQKDKKDLWQLFERQRRPLEEINEAQGKCYALCCEIKWAMNFLYESIKGRFKNPFEKTSLVSLHSDYSITNQPLGMYGNSGAMHSPGTQTLH